ncbi:precorrin-3B synthase [Bradyrhizobium arachidis]|uniref:precorrin-3B synthase n=1 Tax=Bradyrhizobium arachidis TaxID=858423 RepID=UPI002163DF79|nr:precorrin-3B synthase [Bradyrhizobium arachidis]UVO26347.1 precorrin-3B synthase [Bradyrhizobium arachidis]
MSDAAIKGWCPGALRPMLSGDGLVVRVRPYGGRLSAQQAAGIADLAERHGNGLIDLTSRANLQIRGVGDAGHRPLLDGLARLGLLDADTETERRRNVLVSPFWRVGDDTPSLAAEFEQALSDCALDLPTKFGFAIDEGTEGALAAASADVRIERDPAGHLIVRADGAEFGCPVSRADAVAAVLALAEWFIASGGRGRMAAHLRDGAKLPDALRGHAEPAPVMASALPGLCPQGALVGAAFGQLTPSALHHLARLAPALRMTPWRMLLLEGLHAMRSHDDLITRSDDPLLRAIACSGAPRCREAHADTRELAVTLAPHIAPDAHLHVSGCAKGCAHSGPASITLVATGAGYDLVSNGTTRDAPVLRGLSADSILASPSIVGGC